MVDWVRFHTGGQVGGGHGVLLVAQEPVGCPREGENKNTDGRRRAASIPEKEGENLCVGEGNLKDFAVRVQVHWHCQTVPVAV